MSYRFRFATASDLLPCRELLRAEGCFLASEQTWDAMLPAWPMTFSNDLASFVVHEDMSLSGPERLQSFGLSVMVSDAFASHLRSGAQAFAGALLYNNPGFSREHVLSRAAVGRANANEGLNLLVLHNPMRHRDLADPRLGAIMPTGLASFIFTHAGYNLKSIFWEVYGVAFAEILASSGYSLIDNFAAQPEVQAIPEERRPFLMAQFRDGQAARAYSTEGMLLNVIKTPILSFTPTQQRLLRHALLDLEDRELAQAMSVTMNSVKQHWQAIFAKTRKQLPALFPESPLTTEGSGGEGARTQSPRKAILNYLRQHMEEVRPYTTRQG